MASDMFVVCYPAVETADEVMRVARHLQSAHLLRLEDSVVVRRGDDGRLVIHHNQHRRGVETAFGAVLGAVLGKAFGRPLLGSGLGAALGAVANVVPDNMIDDAFIDELTQRLGPNTSAVFALIRRQRCDELLSAPDKVTPELGRFGGTLLHTTLTTEQEERLQMELDEAHRNAVRVRSATLSPPGATRRRVSKRATAHPR